VREAGNAAVTEVGKALFREAFASVATEIAVYSHHHPDRPLGPKSALLSRYRLNQLL
jgi:hypothetical protein